MKQKIIIALSSLLILCVAYLIATDLFSHKKKESQNPYEYNLSELKQIDSTLIQYKIKFKFKTGLNSISAIAIGDSVLFVSGDSVVVMYSQKGVKLSSFTTDVPVQCMTLSENSLWVGKSGHIEQYSKNGEKLKNWDEYMAGGLLTSMAADDKSLYAADAVHKLVLVYDHKGKLLGEIGKKDTINGIEGFHIPSHYFDLALGQFNDLWIVNPGRRRLDNFSVSGRYLTSWGKTSSDLDGFTGCCNPAHFAVLPGGEFITYEKGLDRVKKYDPSGNFESVVTGAGYFKGKEDFNQDEPLVKDLATDGSGNIYIADIYGYVTILSEK